nr:centromere-associated protein E isoform X2 [Paramormyrops kingsleyae]
MADESAVKVCVRVRPLIQREQDSTEVTDLVPVHWKADKQAIHQVDEGCITKTFNFDRVFSAVETTKQLYQEIAKPLVVSTVQGYNGTIFAYGQTSSGKTFTMMGSSHMPGVIPLAMEDVFLTIKNCPKKEFLLRVSYMEIYNETVTDLLCDSWKRKPLEIREGNYKNVYVADLTEELVTSADQALAWIRKGEKNRHYGKTKMNQRSSRSHTIFRMILESRERSDPASGENADGAIIVSHLNLVDLAGAERASQTGAEGARLKEGCNINRSLFTLGQVIKKLSEESQGGFTNYRDSKLTRILQNSLGGNAKTVIICTITPATVDETLSTLQFASTAKRMKNDPHVTEVSDDGALLRRYRNEIVDLKRRLEEVSTVTRTAETEKEVLAQLLQEKDQLQREQEDRIKNLTNIIVTSTKFVAVKKVPKRRMTWGGKLLRPPLEAQSCANSELSFAEPSVKRRKAELQSLGEADEEGDDFDSRWDNLEQLGLDGDMNQSSITIRSFYEGEFSSPCLNELSEKVAGLELQLKTEALEKQVALETKAALESRLAELELKEQEKKASLDVSLTELEAEVQEKQEALETRTALEVRLAELEAEVQEKREAVETRTALEVRLAELEAEVQEKREAVETRAALEVRLAELEAEVQEKREAVETRAALEVRLAELEAEVQEKREAVETRAALEVRLAELEAEVQEKREAVEIKVAELQCQLDMSTQCLPKPSQEQYKKDLGETIQLCETLVSEKEAVEVQRDLAIQECLILKEENCTLSQDKERLLREVQEKQELEEFSALEQESTKQYETELKDEIASLQSAVQLSLTRAAELEVRAASLSAELKSKDERIAELQNLSGKDLVQQVERLSRSLSDAEAVSRDAKRDWAVLRSEKLGLQESVSALTESSEKLKVEVQTLRDQQGADKARFKKMETDLQRELQGAFEETAKLTVLLDGKVPRSMSLTDNIELERQVSRLKKELELAQEEVKGLSTFRELPVKVEQLMQQIGDLTQDLCSCQAEKEALVAAWEASDARVQKLIEDLQQAQDGLERAVGTEAELETLRADAQHWVQEKEQLLESVETLKQEVLQRQEGESSLKHKLAEQQRLVTDLQMILAESRETTNRNQQSFEQKSEQLQKKGHQLDEELEELKAERSQLRRDLEENAQQVQHRIEEFEELRFERDQLKSDLQENVEMMIENQEELRVAQEKIRDQQKCIQDLETRTGEMKSQLMHSLPNVEDLKGQIQQLSEELQLVRSERDSLLSERTDSAQGVEEKLEKLHSQVTSITQERNQLQEILEGVREERNQLKNDIEENVMRIQQLGLELQVMQSERDSLLSERTDSAQEVEEKLEKLHSQVTSITQERDQLQEILQALREERNQLKKDLQENLEKAIKVQDDLKLQQIQSEEAQAQFQLQVQQQAEDLERLKSERGCLEDDLQKHVGKIQQLGEELQLVRSERDSLLSERTDSAQGLEEKLEKLHSQVTSITQERDQLQEMLEGVRAERNQLKNDIEENVVRIQQLGVELQVMQSERDTLLSERSKTAQGVEEKLEKLHSQMTSITQERDQLQEILKALREERNQLKNDLQENLEKVLKFQDELQHQKTLKEAHTELQLQVKRQSVELDALREKRTHLKCDLQKSVEAAEEELQQQKSQSEDAQTILHLKVKQLGEELEGEREEVRRFKKKLDEASAKLLPEASQSRSVAEESRRLLYGKLEESERLLQDLLDRCQLLREQALGASTELMAQLDESSLVQNELVFRTLPSIPKATRQIYRNVRKNTDDFSGFVCQTARVYAHLATVHRQQFEAQAHHDLACMEEMRLQDLLLQRAQGQRTIQGQTVLQLQDLWDQRASELLEKRQSCIQKLQSILGELESGLAQNSASVPPELAEQRCTNEELRPLCDGPSLDPAALEGLLQRELSRQAAAVQPRKELYQRLQAEYFQADSRLQVFKATAQRQLMDHRGRSLALLQSTQTDHEGAQTAGSGSLLNDPQLVIQLQKAEQMVMVLQTRLKPLEKSHVAACDKASKLAQNVLLLKQQLQEVQTQLEERQKAVESLKKQLEAQVRKGVAPGTEELEEMKAKLFRMELEQSAQASSCQEKVATMTALLDHKEDTLRKLKEMLRKAQNQGDESFIAGGPAIARVSSGAGAARLVQSTVQVERAKLESDMKHLEQEVERLESLVSSQKEEIGKWRGRAVRLKETQRDLQKHERPSPAPLTPSKRGQLAAADAPSPMKKPADRSGLPGHEDGSSKAPPSDESDPESDLPTALPPPSPDPSPQMGPGSTTEDKCKEWWPMSPSQADNCKAQ